MRGQLLLGAFVITLVACGSSVEGPVEVHTGGDAAAVDEAALYVHHGDTAPAATETSVAPPGEASELTLSVADVAVTEADTKVAFVVTLSRAVTDVVSVRYATSDGTASATGSAASGGKDYSPASGVLDFAPGETRKTITVAIAGDSITEADETFVLTLKSVNAALGRGSATCTIRNDD